MTDPVTAVALLTWGTLAGLDLVTFPQVLLARPLVAATVAGVLAGDLQAGLGVGMVLELFALDVLPVGAAKYPDYGPAAVGAAVLAVGQPLPLVMGVAVFYGLAGAVLGAWSLSLHRRMMGAVVRQCSAELASGDPAVIARVHWRGVFGDAARSAVVTLGLVSVATLLGPRLALTQSHTAVTAVAVGTGIAAAAGGAIRRAGHGARLRWLAIGVAVGTTWVVMR